MARTPFQVEILTPEGEVFNEEVEMLSTRTAVGSLGVLANHTPLLGMLNSCASGVAVVNIDNGFGAAYVAASINARIHAASGTRVV